MRERVGNDGDGVTSDVDDLGTQANPSIYPTPTYAARQTRSVWPIALVSCIQVLV